MTDTAAPPIVGLTSESELVALTGHLLREHVEAAEAAATGVEGAHRG